MRATNLVVAGLAALGSAQGVAEGNTGKLDHLDYYRRASAQLAAGHEVSALADLRKVLELSPQFAPAHYYLAATYLKLGYSKKASEYASHSNCSDERCASILRESQEYASLISDAQGMINEEPGTCVQCATDALELAPKSVEALRLRSQCQFSRGNSIEAVVDLRQVVQQQPSDTVSAARLAVALFVWLDDRENSFKLLRRALQYDNDAPECKWATKQLRELEKVLKGPVTKIKYGDVSSKVRELQAWVSQTTTAEGDDGDLLDNLRRNRCDALAHKGQWERAARVCAHVRDIDPEFRPAQLVQAYLDKSAGNSGAAQETLFKLLRGQELDNVLSGYAQNLYKEIEAERQQRQYQQYFQYQQQQQGSGGGGGPALSPDKDLYSILGVDKGADTRTIRKAYRELSKKYHPDKYKGKDMTDDEVMAKMQDINEAYETLSNEDRRREYDGQRSAGSGPGPGAGAGFQGPPGFDDRMFAMFRQHFKMNV